MAAGSGAAVRGRDEHGGAPVRRTAADVTSELERLARERAEVRRRMRMPEILGLTFLGGAVYCLVGLPLTALLVGASSGWVLAAWFGGPLVAAAFFFLDDAFVPDIRPLRTALRCLATRERRLIAGSDERPPILLLYSSDQSLGTTELRTIPGSRVHGSPDVDIGGRYTALDVARALSHQAQVVAVGLEEEDDQDGIILNIRCEENEWLDKVAEIGDGAAAIVIIPGPTRGLLSELRLLRTRRLLHKTLVLMLPRSRWHLGVRRSPDLRSRWRSVQESVRPLGVLLPDHEPRGMLFVPEERFSVARSCRFSRWRSLHGNIRRAFAALDPGPLPTALPLATILERIASGARRAPERPAGPADGPPENPTR